MAVGVVVLLEDLKGAIVDDEEGFSDTAGDTSVVVDSTVLVTGFVELGTVKGLELDDGEVEIEDILFVVEAGMLATVAVGLGCEIFSVVFGLLEDNEDIVDVLGWLDD